jgi:hypothetical protein
MVTETLVKEALLSEMIFAGADLIKRLDEADFSVAAALWLYLPESGVWRLVIASPEVGLSGPKKVYKKIQSIAARIPLDGARVSLNDITVIEAKDPLISSLKAGLETGATGKRLIKTAMNGLFIEDAYIYRIS